MKYIIVFLLLYLFTASAIAAVLRSFRELVISPAQVAAVKVPTLGIVGSADPTLLHLQDLKKLRPAMKLVIIDGATHSGDRGARFTCPLLSFKQIFFRFKLFVIK